MSEPLKTTPSFWQRSTTGRLFRWVFSARGARRIFIVVAWIVTAIALFYGEENLRGRHAWNQYREASEARGESLDFGTYIPKQVPDDQNFAATPFLHSFMLLTQSELLTNDFYARVDNHIGEPRVTSGRRHFEDLVAWKKAWSALQSGPLPRSQKFSSDNASPSARAAAAPTILEGMKSDEAAFAELRAASIREFSRFPLKYDLENPSGILLPHLAKIRMVCQRLNLQACAELADGQPEEALADVKLCLSLADSIKSEPFLISMLVRVACLQIATQPVWEGLAEHRWTEAQLQELQTRFASYDFLTDMQQPLKTERAMAMLTIDSAENEGPARLVPSGWWYQEKLNYGTFYDDEMKGVVDLAAKTISPTAAEANARAMSEVLSVDDDFPSQRYGHFPGRPVKAFLHHRLMASMFLPALKNFCSKIAAAQITANQAALACALERYWLANGRYPDTLAALSPKFIARVPNDVIGGQPYKYRRTDDGKFILYSVGWNEKDDGGVPGKTLFDTTQGDWVWSYPAR